MKKWYIFLLALVLFGCVEVGNFDPKRERLYRSGTSEDANYCEQNSDKCIKGVAW